MSNKQAADLRAHINSLALELETCTAAAERRALKQAIRTAEFKLSGAA